jgi:predicted nucleotidyltransferase
MSPSIAEIQRKVSDVMRRRGVLRASIFGSVARGEADDDSDVDFLVLGCDVDVATPKSLHPELRDRILGELVAIL